MDRNRHVGSGKSFTILIKHHSSVKVVVSLVIFLVSKKFHPSFGASGTELRLDSNVSGRDEAARLACRRGWEW